MPTGRVVIVMYTPCRPAPRHTVREGARTDVQLVAEQWPALAARYDAEMMMAVALVGAGEAGHPARYGDTDADEAAEMMINPATLASAFAGARRWTGSRPGTDRYRATERCGIGM